MKSVRALRDYASAQLWGNIAHNVLLLIERIVRLTCPHQAWWKYVIQTFHSLLSRSSTRGSLKRWVIHFPLQGVCTVAPLQYKVNARRVVFQGLFRKRTHSHRKTRRSMELLLSERSFLRWNFILNFFSCFFSKSENAEECDDSRSVALSPLVMKVIEKVIKDQKRPG